MSWTDPSISRRGLALSIAAVVAIGSAYHASVSCQHERLAYLIYRNQIGCTPTDKLHAFGRIPPGEKPPTQDDYMRCLGAQQGFDPSSPIDNDDYYRADRKGFRDALKWAGWSTWWNF